MAMTYPREYEQLLRFGTWPERTAVAKQFAKAGEEGSTILASVALDESQPELGGVTAFARIPVTSPVALRRAIPSLLVDPSEALRYWAIKKASGAGLREFIEDIRKLIDDPTEFYDMDDLL